MTTFITPSMAPGLGGGGSATIRVASTTSIPLDTGGAGKAMPLTAGATIAISSPTTLTIAAGAVEGGSLEGYFSVTSTLTLPTTYPGAPAGSGVVVNGTITAGFKYRLVFGISAGDLVIFCFQQAAILTAPGQVTGLTIGTPTSSSLPLTWTAPASNGGSAITDYFIEYKATASPTWLTFAHTASTTTGIVIPGLTASTSYDTRVSAVNAIGTGIPSAVATGSTAAATPAPVFSAQSAPAGTIGVAYSYTYAASNTTSFALFSGTLPAGLTLNTATGVLSGTPTTAATSAFVISATGPGGTTNSTAQSVTVAAASGRSDTFNRANSTSPNPPSDGLSNWTDYGAAGGFGISANTAIHQVAGNAEMVLSGCPSDGTFLVSVVGDGTTASPFSGGQFKFAGITFRAVDANNKWQLVAKYTGVIELQSVAAGTATTQATFTSTLSNSGGVLTPWDLKVVTSGTNIQTFVRQGGAFVAAHTFTSSLYQTATNAGIFSAAVAGDLAIMLDNFSAA